MFASSTLLGCWHRPISTILSIRKYAAVKYNQKVLCGDILGLQHNINNLTLNKWLKSHGHTYVLATSSEQYLSALQTANVVISPLIHTSIKFNKHTLESLSCLNLIITDTIENIDLQAAWDRNITVLECNNSKITDIADEIVRKMFALLSKNKFSDINDEYLQVKDYFSGQKIGCMVGKHVGKILMKRLKQYDVDLHFYDPVNDFKISKLNVLISDKYQYRNGVTYHSSIEGMLPILDVLIIGSGAFDAGLLEICKNGLYIVDCANAKWINERELVNAINNKKLGGYFGTKMIVKDQMLHTFGTGFRNKEIIAKSDKDGIKQLLRMYLKGHAYPFNNIIIDPSKDIVSKQASYIDRIEER